MTAWPLALLALIPAAVYAGVAGMQAHAGPNRLLDTPTPRSSHTRPTLTGGGLTFALIVMLGCLGWRVAVGGVGGNGLTPDLLVGGGILTLTGWQDDRKGLSIRLRLIVQILALALVIAKMAEPAEVGVGPYALPWGVPVKLFFLLAGLWLINAYNFMDGLDGLAAVVAILAALAGAGLFWGLPIALPLLMTGLAVLGFLPWNWPPAKIFMGDTGSVFLGFVFALAWLHTSGPGQGFLIWPILLAVFLVDATATLLGRIARREKWYESHCSHAYQLAGKRWGHKKVTLTVGGFTLFWLIPSAALCQVYPNWALAIAAGAYFPVVIAYFVCKRHWG